MTATNNALKCSKGAAERLSHKITKFWLSTYCWENGLDFGTECVFQNNQRADFVIKDWGVAVEVLNSEGYNDFLKKRYPLPTIPIPAMIELKELLDMMKDLEATDGTGADHYIKKYTVRIQDFQKSEIKTMEDVA